MKLLKTWRWFGEEDPVRLSDIRQMGVEGVVTALHHIPNGVVWPADEIMRVRNMIESYGMKWSVVESLPVSEGIKLHNEEYSTLISNYQESLKNLGQCGINRICYNFMPVLDWARTDLHYKLENGGEVMLFDYATFAAFDTFILKRPKASQDYPEEILAKAKELARRMTEQEKDSLAHQIIVLSQVFIDGLIDESVQDYKQQFLNALDTYHNIDKQRLRENLSTFLQDIIPVAEQNGVRMAIHPDDPPFPLLGLPRIVSTMDDLKWICNKVDSTANGITFCTGSLSADRNNNLEEIIDYFGDRIHFTHLRNNTLLAGGSFHEMGQIEGNVDMVAIIEKLLKEQIKREEDDRKDVQIPFRPDHGIKMLDDFNRETNPGYPLIGRLKGMSEIDGIQTALEYKLKSL